MSNNNDGCTSVIATLILGAIIHCALGALVQFLLVEWFSYHVGYWVVVGSIWLVGFILRCLK